MQQTNPHFIKVRFLNGRWRSDLIADYPAVTQLRKEAGLTLKVYPDPGDAYDKLLVAASKHGLGLETETTE